MQYNDLSNSEQSTPGEFQPKINLYEEEAFSNGQFHGSTGPVSMVVAEQSFKILRFRAAFSPLKPIVLIYLLYLITYVLHKFN
jgi:hypothetical protein